MHFTLDSNYRKPFDDRKHLEFIFSCCSALCHWEGYYNPEYCDENQVGLKRQNFCSKCTCIILCDSTLKYRLQKIKGTNF